MRKNCFIALLFVSLFSLALPHLCSAQQYRYFEEGTAVPDQTYEDGLSYKWGKHIWIWQYDQIGEAIEDGRIIFSFRIISGRVDKYRTREGDFRIFEKKGWDYNNCDGVEMPLAMFFDGIRALHGWSRTWPFPADKESPWLASHGCVSVDQIERLNNWAPEGTSVHIRSKRIGYR